jgi:SRSO17 transposase
MPELEEFLEPFRVQFAQSKSAETLRQYLTGQLSEHPIKNCATISEIVPQTDGQQFQNLLTEVVLDDASLNRQRIERMLELGTEGDAALVIDDTGFAKQGRASVGVARQYSGTLGKVTVKSRSLASMPNGHWPGRWRLVSICRANGLRMRTDV